MELGTCKDGKSLPRSEDKVWNGILTRGTRDPTGLVGAGELRVVIAHDADALIGGRSRGCESCRLLGARQARRLVVRVTSWVIEAELALDNQARRAPVADGAVELQLQRLIPWQRLYCPLKQCLYS